MRLRDRWSKLFRRAQSAPDAFAQPPDSISEEAEIDPFDPFPEPVELELTDVFDLHTIAPRDVKRVVEEYLLEARRKGFPSVRIIHGKGIGVQREMVRGILARTTFVRDFTDAPPVAGGWGATIAHLSSKDE
jgi:dsDNA-specific endonuclease/ATPase MutS2